MSGSSSTTRIRCGCVVSGGIHDGGPAGLPSDARLEARARTVERGGTVRLRGRIAAHGIECGAEQPLPSTGQRGQRIQQVRDDRMGAHDSQALEYIQVRAYRRVGLVENRGKVGDAEWSGGQAIQGAEACGLGERREYVGDRARIHTVSFSIPTVATRAKGRGGGCKLSACKAPAIAKP